MPDYDQMMSRAQRATQQNDLRKLVKQVQAGEVGAVDTTIMLRLDEIIVDERIQVRVAGLDEEKVEQYAEMMRAGESLPPIIVFRDAETDDLYLADGFHRVEAARRAGLTEIQAEVRPGGYAAAFEYAEEANLAHGLNLSVADKRGIFARRLARGHVWADLSAREIARALGVSHPTVTAWKSSLTGKNLPVSGNEGKKRAVLTADGRLMKTGRIAHANQKRAARKPTPQEPVGAFEDQEASVTDRIMAALHEHGDLGPSRLSQITGLTYNEFAQTMDDLVDDGWVERRRDPQTHTVLYRALVEVEQQPDADGSALVTRKAIVYHLTKAAEGLAELGETDEAEATRRYARDLGKEWGVRGI